jgi:hypothetical protein
LTVLAHQRRGGKAEAELQFSGIFLDAADRAISIIRDAPDRWRIIQANVRGYIMPRFPYAVHYQVMEDHIYIVASKHHSRHPNYWRYRLAD